MVSSVASGGPAWTRLPGVTSARLTRPEIGERTSVHSRLRRAVATAASAARTLASPWACSLVRLSSSSREIAWTATSRSARCTSRPARSAPVRARSSSASARARSAW